MPPRGPGCRGRHGGPELMCAPKEKVEDMAPSSRAAVLLASHRGCRTFGIASLRDGLTRVPLPRFAIIDPRDRDRRLSAGAQPAGRWPPTAGATGGPAGHAAWSRVGRRPASAPGVALGSLAERGVAGRRSTRHRRRRRRSSWWIPAAAVWSDGDDRRLPSTPGRSAWQRAATREAALLKGLSDRLGWEAVLEFEQRGDLPVATAAGQAGAPTPSSSTDGSATTCPTVVVLGADTMRWGAASTWPGAIRRALFGEDPMPTPSASSTASTNCSAAPA